MGCCLECRLLRKPAGLIDVLRSLDPLGVAGRKVGSGRLGQQKDETCCSLLIEHCCSSIAVDGSRHIEVIKLGCVDLLLEQFKIEVLPLDQSVQST